MRFKSLESFPCEHRPSLNLLPSASSSSSLLPSCICCLHYLILVMFPSYRPLPFLTFSDQLKLSERHLLFSCQSFISTVDRGFPSFKSASIFLSITIGLPIYFTPPVVCGVFTLFAAKFCHLDSLQVASSNADTHGRAHE